MSQQFIDEVEEMLRKLRLNEKAEMPELLLEQLNSAFWSLFEENKLLNEEEREHPEVVARYLDAQRLYHRAGLEMIGQIADCLVEKQSNDGAVEEQTDEQMETDAAVQSITDTRQQVQIDEDLLKLNPPKTIVEQASAMIEQAMQEEAAGGGQPPAEQLAIQPDTSKGAIPKLVRADGTNYNDGWEDEEPIPMRSLHDLPYEQYERIVRPFFELSKMSEPNPASLNDILEAIAAVRATATELNFSIAQSTNMLIALIQHKMDSTSKEIWSFQLEHEEPSLDQLVSFLLKRSERLRSERTSFGIAQRNREREAQASQPGPSSQGATALPPAKKKKTVCPYCHQDHFLHRCDMFKKLGLADKMAVLKRNTLCINCFSPAHATQVCKQGVCKRCNLKHNSLLCSKLDSNKL